MQVCPGAKVAKGPRALSLESRSSTFNGGEHSQRTGDGKEGAGAYAGSANLGPAGGRPARQRRRTRLCCRRLVQKAELLADSA